MFTMLCVTKTYYYLKVFLKYFSYHCGKQTSKFPSLYVHVSLKMQEEDTLTVIKVKI